MWLRTPLKMIRMTIWQTKAKNKNKKQEKEKKNDNLTVFDFAS